MAKAVPAVAGAEPDGVAAAGGGAAGRRARAGAAWGGTQGAELQHDRDRWGMGIAFRTGWFLGVDRGLLCIPAG